MNKINFNQEMKKIIGGEGKDSSLLLHACCAPCASTCMEKVRDDMNTTVYFFNPNITNEEEFNKRASELKRLIDIYNDYSDSKIDYICDSYNPKEFIDIAKGYEDCPERGERCIRCFELRLRAAGTKALEEGYDYFTTTLTLSPLKDVDKLNEIGYRVASELAEVSDKAPKWLPSDFKKEGGYQRSIELSKEYNLYRQDYCGCIYSKLERERQKAVSRV